MYDFNAKCSEWCSVHKNDIAGLGIDNIDFDIATTVILRLIKFLSLTANVKSLWVSILISSLRKKASQKLHVFPRIARSLKYELRKFILNAFIASQFPDAPDVWMFVIRKLNNHLNHINERALRIVYQDHNSEFDELLAKYGSFKIHDLNL